VRHELPSPKDALAVLSGVVGGLFGGLITAGRKTLSAKPKGEAEVFLVKTWDRRVGVRLLLRQFNMEGYSGKRVALKANFNSADPFPASTHIDTLREIVRVLKEAGAADLSLAERSGMGNTREVLEKMGVLVLARELDFNVLVLDELGAEAWQKIEADGTHWVNGFYIPKLFLKADKVIQTCCLKTHRFGGHFTLSLKNSIGLVAKRVPGLAYDFMMELHASPHQRTMIAEVNSFYKVDLVIMDAIKAFVSGGPEHGKVVEPNLLLASGDRVAIDAAGLAILRSYGSTKEVMEGSIFQLEQIRRAAELGVGVSSPSDIKLTPLDEGSSEVVEKIESILKG